MRYIEPLNYAIKVYTPADIVGTGAVIIGPSNDQPYQLLSVSFRMVCGVAVASRVPLVYINNGLTRILSYSGTPSQTALQTRDWSFAIGGNQISDTVNQCNMVPLSTDYLCIGNDAVNLVIGAGDAGDDITNIVIRLGIFTVPRST